jgi:hypothetical protein
VSVIPPINAATVRLRRVTPLLPVADGDLVLFAETEDGQVIGWLPGHPEAERGADPRRRAALPVELSSDNPRSPQLAGHLGAVIYKRHRVYRKLRDLVLDKTYDIPYHLWRRSA